MAKKTAEATPQDEVTAEPISEARAIDDRSEALSAGGRAETEATNGRPTAEAPADAPAENALTIEELAADTGMTVRNIRAHQSRGLLPAPAIRGRTGYYGSEHITRLRLISEMQADGFNLKAIERLLAGAGAGAAEELLGFKRALTAPWEEESPEFLDAEELATRFGNDINERALAKAIKLGMLVPFGEGRYEVPSPTLLRAGEDLARMGVSPDATLRVLETMSRHSDGVAEAFVKLFLENLWRPFEQAGRPEDRLSEVREAIERLRPLASEALLAVFQRNMTKKVERAFGRELEKGR